MEAAFPVVFSDGEQEIGIGDVVVFPTLNFKGLQTILAERIGLSPYQFSVFLADRERPGARIPITGKTNFLAISRERDNSWEFLVVLKRTKRERRRKEVYDDDKMMMSRFDPPPGDLMLLRRDGSNISINRNGFPGMDLGRVGYEKRVRELRMEKERYLMNMGLGLDSVLSMDGGVTHAERAVCEDCLRGRQIGFHWCVYDAVTYGFKSPAGPIARPGTKPS